LTSLMAFLFLWVLWMVPPPAFGVVDTLRQRWN
jgi:hypothetical protein